MRTIRWGIIGCGDVTEVKSGPGFQKAANSTLVAVMRRRGDLARDYARRHGVPRWYDDAKALVDDPEVDAVYVATPPSSHVAYTLMAAAAGKPVYVEKPMALDVDECQAMIRACRAARVPLFVAYYRRALPRFVEIKRRLEARAIGDVRFVTMTLHAPLRPEDLDRAAPPWRVTPAISGGGYFVDVGSHMLDLLDHLLGPVRAVKGFAGNQAGRYAAEDVVTATLVLESGVHVAGAWCFSAFGRRDLTEIVGSEGTISFSTFDAAPVTLTTGKGTEQLAFDSPAHVQQPLIQSAVDELNGVGACPSTGETAARTTWVMEQILRPGGHSPD
jgi:predicted dehydrogenase